MTISQWSLAGLRVGLSVAANPEELARCGFTEAGMNRFTVRLARALLSEGGALAFGHDWRPEGVMEAIASIAFDYQRPMDPSDAQVSILNLLPWPNERSETDPALLARLRGVVDVQSAADLPEDVRPLAKGAVRGTDTWRYVRARGLTHQRRKLTGYCHARVAFGGKLHGYDGRLPGIVEEVLLALEANQPVYLAGLLGGASAALGRVLIDGQEPSALWSDLRLADLYQRHRQATSTDPDAGLDAKALTELVTSPALRESFLANGLKEKENRRLLETTLEEEAIDLILRGLKEIASTR